MLLMLGTSLAELRITRLTLIAAGTLAIQCAMPVAILTHLFAQKYGGPSREIAGMILISTGLALVSLPVVLRLVR